MDPVKWMLVCLGFGALLLVSPRACLAGASAGPFEGYRWKNRVLLVFAPSDSDSLYGEQIQPIAGQSGGFVDRDLLLYCLSGGRHTGATPVSLEDAQTLRRQLGFPENTFALILIGKDGGVKLRSERPVAIREIFGLIDGMPMRQREMREKAGP